MLKSLKNMFALVMTTQTFESPLQTVSVEELHHEINELENICIDEYKKIIEQPVPQPTQIVTKADKMSTLGFSSKNETIVQAKETKNLINSATELLNLSKKSLEYINECKLKYTDKIIPLSEFEKVLKKYNLVYATADNYIKDVPEKNVLEIENSVKTKYNDEPKDVYKINKVKVYRDSYKYLANTLQNIIVKTGYNHGIPSELFERKIITSTEKSNISYINVDIMDMNFLFIAAPISHFDTGNLHQEGFHLAPDVKTIAIVDKDPIAFKFLRGPEDNNDYVRIISKWGTNDDQSYLDPIVQNENLN